MAEQLTLITGCSCAETTIWNCITNNSQFEKPTKTRQETSVPKISKEHQDFNQSPPAAFTHRRMSHRHCLHSTRHRITPSFTNRWHWCRKRHGNTPSARSHCDRLQSGGPQSTREQHHNTSHSGNRSDNRNSCNRRNFLNGLWQTRCFAGRLVAILLGDFDTVWRPTHPAGR